MLMDEIAVASETGIERADAFPEHREGRAPAHEERTFDLPSSIWAMMFTSYAVFLGGLAILVGGTFDALGIVIISTCFAIMYFGTATVMVAIARAHRTSGGSTSTSFSGRIETLTGSLSYGAAAAQILTVPAMFGFFALCVVIIRFFNIGG